MSQNIVVKNKNTPRSEKSANRIQKAIENDAKRAAKRAVKYKPRKVEEHENTTGQPHEQLTGQPHELTPNQKIIDDYTKYVTKNPELLPPTESFNIIENIYQTHILDKYKFKIINKTVKEEDKKTSLVSFFTDTDTEKLTTWFKESINTKSLDIILNNNNSSNLYIFLTKALWYSIPNSFTDNNNIDISLIKYKTGNDLHRSDMTINSQKIDRTMFSQLYDNYKRTDLYNSMLMKSLDKEEITISLNTIVLLDIYHIQNLIQVPIDAVFGLFVENSKTIYQTGAGFPGEEGKTLQYTIVLNKQSQYIETYFRSPLTEQLIDGNLIPYGKFECWFTANLIDKLNYSFKILITPYSENSKIPKQVPPSNLLGTTAEAPDDTAENQETRIQKINPEIFVPVAGASLVLGLGAAAATVFSMGLLGGKTNKHSYKKYKNRKSTRKNKKRKTKNNKSIYKNKKQKTKKNKKL